MSTETKGTAKPGSGGESYERRDANVRALVQFAFWLAVVIFAAILGMKWIFNYFAKVQQLGPPASPFENARVLPPNPRLQVKPRVELQNYQDVEQEALTTYGWVDKHNGIVRIPIDRAMDIVLEHGLTPRPAGGVTAAGQSADATKTTHVRTFPQPASQGKD